MTSRWKLRYRFLGKFLRLSLRMELKCLNLRIEVKDGAEVEWLRLRLS